MSQVKRKVEKYQNGGSAPNINKGRTLTVKVNGQLMDIDEQDLNVQYENFLSGIGRKGSNTGNWNQDYNDLLNNIQTGMSNGNYFEFNVGSQSANQIKYNGELSNTDRGLDSDGNPEKQGLFNNIFGGGVKKEAVRNGALLNFLGNTIASSKTAQDLKKQQEYDAEQSKIKQEQEENKKLEDARALDRNQDVIKRFDFNNNFLADFNNSAVKIQDLFKAYHGNPNNQRNLSLGYLRRLKDLALSGQLDDQKVIDLYNQNNSFDLAKIKDVLKNLNLDDANLNLQDTYNSIGMGNEYRALQDKNFYDDILRNEKLQEIQNKTVEANAQNQYNDTIRGVDTESGTGTGNTEGAEGANTTNTTDPNNPDTVAFDFSASNFDNYRNVEGYYKGNRTVFGALEDAYVSGVDKSPELQQIINNAYSSGLTNIKAEFDASKENWINPFDESYWSGINKNYNPYRYTDVNTAKQHLTDVAGYRDITNNFSHYDAGKNAYRIVQEQLKDPTGKRHIPLVRRRIYGPKGALHNANVVQKDGGNYIKIVNTNGTTTMVPLGDYNPQALERSIVNYNFIKKNQFGGTIQNQKAKSEEFGTLTNSNYELTEADYTELAGLAADLTGLGISVFGPAGSISAGVAGVGSTAAQARAKALRGEEWLDSELAVNLGLDLATMIPIAGTLGKTWKVGKAVQRATPFLERALAFGALAGGSTATLDAFNKIKEGDNSIENYTQLAKGITALLAGKRGLTDKKLATTKGKMSNSVDVKINGNNQNIKLTDSQLEQLKLKDVASQKKMIQGLASRQFGVKSADVEVNVNKQVGAKVFGKQIGGKEKSVQIKQTEGERILKQYNNNPKGIMQRLENRAIARQAGKYSQMNQSDYEGVPLVNVGKTYSGTSSNADAISDLKATDSSFNKGIAKTNEIFNKPNVTKGSTDVASQPAAPEKITTKETNAIKEATGSEKYKQNLNKVAKTLDKLKISEDAKRAYSSGKQSIIKQELQEKFDNATSKVIQTKYNTIAKDLNIKLNTKVAPEASKATSESTKTAAAKTEEKATRATRATRTVSKEPVAKPTPTKKAKKVKKAFSGIKFPELTKELKAPVFNASLNNMLPKVKPNLFGTTPVNTNPFNVKSLDVVTPVSKYVPGMGIVKSYGDEAGGNEKLGLTGGAKPTTTIGGKNLFSINKTDLSEWARALANRRAHSLLDTRVSTALRTAPIMPTTTVKGDILSSHAFAQNANRLRTTASTPIISDGALNVASRLAAEAKAGDYEMQGGLNNAQSIRQQEAQNNQLLTQDAAIRAEVASQNNQAIAAAEQGRRQNENSKQTAMFKSIDNAWARQNTIGYGREMQMQHLVNQEQQLKIMNSPIDSNEFPGFQGKTIGEARSEMLNKMNQNQLRLETKGITNEERVRLEQENNKLSAQSQKLDQYMQLKTNRLLQETPRYGDKTYKTPSYTVLNTMGVYKSGGKMSLSERMFMEDYRQKNRIQLSWYNQYSDYIKTKTKDDDRRAEQANRQTSKIIEKALGGK